MLFLKVGEAFWRRWLLSWKKAEQSFNTVPVGETVCAMDIGNTEQGQAGSWPWDEARKVIGLRLKREFCHEGAFGV